MLDSRKCGPCPCARPHNEGLFHYKDMKKIFMLSLAAALCASVNAEGIKILTCGSGVPGIDEPQLMGLGISPDGRYVCGALEMGAGIFVADVEAGEVKWSLCGDEGGELRHVDNNGLAIGFSDTGVTYSFLDPVEKVLTVPAGYRGLIGEDLTSDGSMMIASLTAQSFVTTAAYSTDGVDWKILPVPTKEELGNLDPRLDASAAKYVSADGKVIFGHLGSFGIPIAWIRNGAGEYETDFFPARIDDPELVSVSAMYTNMSKSGKYLVMVGLVQDAATNERRNAPVVYNTETKKVTVYKDFQAIDDTGNGLYPTAISDDGTIIGTIGQPYFYSSGSFIIKGGQTTAERYNTVFPKYDKMLGLSDDLGFNVPVGISADGRYITGYTFYCEDYNDANADAYYVTYVIDTQAEGGSVEGVGADNAAAVVEGIYNLQGQRVNATAKGINIIRMSDGTTRKVVNK